MTELPPGTPSSLARSSSSRGAGGVEQQLADALARIAALEERLARFEETISVNTDGSVEIAAEGQLRLVASNNILLEAGANYIELGITGIDVVSAATLKLESATQRTMTALLQNNAAMNENTGVVRCDTLIANSVVASSYTPGAGNVW
ncbi:MAG: hypothetical protein JNM25_13010 [Planctomycetes bacterium]|nr:hypothetical protein [Planctomycetota bacterium]